MNKTVWIQIKQGTMTPWGKIVNVSSWEPSEPSKRSLYHLNNEHKGFNLDDLVGNDDEVVTGIGFSEAKQDKDRLKLQIQVTKFNVTTGILEKTSRNISSSDKHKQELEIGRDNPLTRESQSVAYAAVNRAPGRYVKFQESSLETDAGQTTIPLFDAVPLEGIPLRPFSGVGLIHKSTPGSGGFLSLRGIGLNYAKIFEDNTKDGKRFDDINVLSRSMKWTPS